MKYYNIKVFQEVKRQGSSACYNLIETREVKFKDWLHIYDEKVVKEGYEKSSNDYLVYRYDIRGYAKIDLEELDISPKKLADALRTYRIRHTNNN